MEQEEEEEEGEGKDRGRKEGGKRGSKWRRQEERAKRSINRGGLRSLLYMEIVVCF